MSYLITGGLGLLGSAFVQHLLREKHYKSPIVIMDKFSYASAYPVKDKDVITYKCNVKNAEFLEHILNEHEITHLVHMASHTDVDSSYSNSVFYTEENVVGTHVLLETCRKYGKLKVLMLISSDEVFGPRDTAANESAMMKPSNPYAATKACQEVIARAYQVSYNLPIITVRLNNLAGKQYPEKVIPLIIIAILDKRTFTVQGSGKQRRCFLHTSDACAALSVILEKGEIGSIYNVGSKFEYSILELIDLLSTLMQQRPHVVFGPDRCFQDDRYLINCDKLKSLGWKQSENIIEQFKDTIEFYKQHRFDYWPHYSKDK